MRKPTKKYKVGNPANGYQIWAENGEVTVVMIKEGKEVKRYSTNTKFIRKLAIDLLRGAENGKFDAIEARQLAIAYLLASEKADSQAKEKTTPNMEDLMPKAKGEVHG